MKLLWLLWNLPVILKNIQLCPAAWFGRCDSPPSKVRHCLTLSYVSLTFPSFVGPIFFHFVFLFLVFVYLCWQAIPAGIAAVRPPQGDQFWDDLRNNVTTALFVMFGFGFGITQTVFARRWYQGDVKQLLLDRLVLDDSGVLRRQLAWIGNFGVFIAIVFPLAAFAVNIVPDWAIMIDSIQTLGVPADTSHVLQWLLAVLSTPPAWIAAVPSVIVRLKRAKNTLIFFAV